MTFDPTTNRAPFYRLTVSQRTTLIAAKHGWERLERGNWKSVLKPRWLRSGIYRAKPAQEVKSTWHNVFEDTFGKPYVKRSYSSQERASWFSEGRIGTIRLDLSDGKLSVEVER